MDEKGLDLNPQIVKNKEELFSSLTDINNIPLFTIEFEDGINAEKRYREDQEILIISRLFTGQHGDESTTQLTSMLFLENNDRIIKKDIVGEVNTNYNPIIATFLLTLTILIIAIYYRYRNNS